MNHSINDSASDLGPFDVLCGRDKESYNNIGNRRFRIMININLSKYMKCKSKADRSQMILAFTCELQQSSANFRFLKRVKEHVNSNSCSKLVVLNRKQSREKIAHALRDAASQHRIMKEKQTIESKKATKSISAGCMKLVDYPNKNGELNGENHIIYNLPRFLPVFDDKAVDLDEISQITESSISEIIDFAWRL